MHNSRFGVDHIRVRSDKPFDAVTANFVRQLGAYDAGVLKELAAGSDADVVKAEIEALAGPSGLMLFGIQDHGLLLRIMGQKRKAVQYVVGNPLIAAQMTQHDIRTSLYAPLRVLIYEDADGKTCLEYDRPSSLFGQFGNEQVAPTAAELDRKMGELVAAAVRE
jgi:uncharacterized protein (DUF302 family)